MRRAAVLLIAGAFQLALPSDAVLTSTTVAPGNSLASAQSLWFSANAVGAVLCVGTNAALACPFGIQTKVGLKVTATFALANKDLAATYRLAVVDGTGPAGVSTVVTASFASNGATTVTLAPGAADVVNVVLKLKGATPRGAYTGTVVVTETASGRSAAIPISFTYP